MAESAPMAMRGFIVVLAALGALLVPHAWALDFAPLLTGYSLASWTERDGVPLGRVRAIVQGDDGYLWLGTDAGLLRFDGVRFATAASLGYADLPTGSVRTLLVARDRTLWIGFDDEAGVRVIRNGRVERAAQEPLAADVSDLAEADAGTIWAATDRGIYSLRDGSWHRHPLPGDADDEALTVYVDRAAGVWVGTETGLYKRTTDRGFERVGASSAAVRGITEDSRGRIWVTDPSVGFRQAEDAQPDPLEREGTGLSIYSDRQSNVWVTMAGQGLWRVRGAAPDPVARIESATVTSGLVSNGLWVAFEDRENNIWLGSQLGLTRLTPHAVRPVVDVGVVRSVQPADDGGVWAGTAGGLLRLSSGQSGKTPTVTRFGNRNVTSLHRDATGTVWVVSSRGLGKLTAGGLAQVTLDVSPPLTDIQSIAHDSSGGLWLADSARGLFRRQGSRVTRYDLPQSVESRAIRFIHSDQRGLLWIAFEGGRLAFMDDKQQLQEVSAAQGFADRTHATLDAIADGERGEVWIGGTGGLTRFADGRFVTVTAATGLPGRRVTAIATDTLGYLWLAIEGAVIRLHPDEFAKASTTPEYRMRHLRFDTSDGLGGVPVGSTNERVARSAGGGLWFVTGWGLTFIDPAAVNAYQGPTDIVVRIEGAVADEERLGPAQGASLPPGTARVRIDYTALRLTTPTRTRFRYKLEGFDADWIDAGTRRQAFYTNLPPGDYRFVVQAEGGDRIWSPTVASWSFTIAPTFYQTKAFYLLVAGLLICSGWGAWRIRLRHVRREFELVLAERARLSREIHDTLLQNLAGVAIQCAGISNALESSSPARAQLSAVRRQVESYVRDIRQAVWDLRAPALETNDLAGALRQFGARATAGTGIRFDLAVFGRPRQFAARIENDVLRVGEESIRNAVRHAHATHIRVELKFEGTSLTLRVLDDGRGLDVSHQAADDRQFGLIGMRERALELGGRLRIAVLPTGGTEVEMVIPADPQPQGA